MKKKYLLGRWSHRGRRSPTSGRPHSQQACHPQDVLSLAAHSHLARTPLYELWLRDPTGYNVELCACLTPDELATMPADWGPSSFLAGTGP
jgi:hypothetical protein